MKVSAFFCNLSAAEVNEKLEEYNNANLDFDWNWVVKILKIENTHQVSWTDEERVEHTKDEPYTYFMVLERDE